MSHIQILEKTQEMVKYRLLNQVRLFCEYCPAKCPTFSYLNVTTLVVLWVTFTFSDETDDAIADVHDANDQRYNL